MGLISMANPSPPSLGCFQFSCALGEEQLQACTAPSFQHCLVPVPTRAAPWTEEPQARPSTAQQHPKGLPSRPLLCTHAGWEGKSVGVSALAEGAHHPNLTPDKEKVEKKRNTSEKNDRNDFRAGTTLSE